MKPTELQKFVYWEHLERFGEPDASYRYDDPPESKTVEYPPIIDVLIWFADEDLNMTTFSTVGMSNLPMNGCDHRCELHFAVEGTTNESNNKIIGSFLGNLTLYPFMYSLFFDWWHVLNNPYEIPLFPDASSILFHPAFIKDGWEAIHHESAHVKILNIVPITKNENEFRKERGINALLDYFYENEINYFTNRHNKAISADAKKPRG